MIIMFMVHTHTYLQTSKVRFTLCFSCALLCFLFCYFFVIEFDLWIT